MNFKQTLVLVLTLFILACQPSAEIKYSDDLAGMKAELKDKSSALKSLQSRVDELKEEINRLDPPKEKDPVLVSTLQIEPIEFKRYTDVQAVVVSEDLVSASSETGGRIIELLVKENDYVQKNQLIARIDMQTMDKQIAEVQKSLELATIVYQRQKRLWDQNIGSEIQYLEAQNNKERIEKSLETMNAQRSKSNVYAPIAGVVDMEFLKQGEMSSPGMPIVNILNTYNVKFVADVPESYLENIKRGDYVDIYIPALDKEMKKRVSQIGRTIDPANRTFKIEINTTNKGAVLKPNLLAEVKFNDLTIKDAVTIPANLIQEEVSGRRYVYKVVQQKGKPFAQKTFIEIGENNGELVVIEDGLSAKDMIVADGAKTISDDTPISIQNKPSEDE